MFNNLLLWKKEDTQLKSTFHQDFEARSACISSNSALFRATKLLKELKKFTLYQSYQHTQNVAMNITLFSLLLSYQFYTQHLLETLQTANHFLSGLTITFKKNHTLNPVFHSPTLTFYATFLPLFHPSNQSYLYCPMVKPSGCYYQWSCFYLISMWF